MSNLTIKKKRHASLIVMLAVCAVIFVGASTTIAQSELAQVADTDNTEENEVSSSITDPEEDTTEEQDVVSGKGDGFNLPPTFPADWTPEDIFAYIEDIMKNKNKKLFLANDGQPKFIGVAANNGFSREYEGLITEDEIQDKKAKLISAPKFTLKIKAKNIKYALTEEESCKEVTYKRKIPKVGDLKEDGIFYICVKATKGNRTWEILSPLKVVRNTTVKGYALVGSESVDCREVPKKKWKETPQVPTNDKSYLCKREKQMIKHDNGTIGIGGTRHELWGLTTSTPTTLVKVWKERQTEDYIWPVSAN